MTQHDDARLAEFWRPLVEMVGTDFSPDLAYAPDRVEPGAIRRYLEPLEFDCPLHTDPEVAREHGFANVTCPYTSMFTFAGPPVWSPGETVFTRADRNAQPERLSVGPVLPPGMPELAGFFVTETESVYVRPVVAGERLGRRGHRLISCVPKRTRVGPGVFATFERECVDEAGERVAFIRATLFLFTDEASLAA